MDLECSIREMRKNHHPVVILRTIHEPGNATDAKVFASNGQQCTYLHPDMHSRSGPGPRPPPHRRAAPVSGCHSWILVPDTYQYVRAVHRVFRPRHRVMFERFKPSAPRHARRQWYCVSRLAPVVFPPISAAVFDELVRPECEHTRNAIAQHTFWNLTRAREVIYPVPTTHRPTPAQQAIYYTLPRVPPTACFRQRHLPKFQNSRPAYPGPGPTGFGAKSETQRPE